MWTSWRTDARRLSSGFGKVHNKRLLMLRVASFTFGPFQENTFIVHDDAGHAAIVDPGCFTTAEWGRLRGFVDEHGLTPDLLLNTHCHLDHIAGNARVHETWGLEPVAHPQEEAVLAWAPDHAKLFGVPLDPSPPIGRFVKHGEIIRLADEGLAVLHVPGHSPGSVCFYSAAHGFVIAGDTLFRGGIGRTDLPGGDHETLLRAIREQLFTLPDETEVFNGHGPRTTVGEEKRSNPFFG